MFYRTAYSQPIQETNKGKRFESFSQALAVFFLDLAYTTGKLYAERSESQGDSIKFTYESLSGEQTSCKRKNLLDIIKVCYHTHRNPNCPT